MIIVYWSFVTKMRTFYSIFIVYILKEISCNQLFYPSSKHIKQNNNYVTWNFCHDTCDLWSESPQCILQTLFLGNVFLTHEFCRSGRMRLFLHTNYNQIVRQFCIFWDNLLMCKLVYWKHHWIPLRHLFLSSVVDIISKLALTLLL